MTRRLFLLCQLTTTVAKPPRRGPAPLAPLTPLRATLPIAPPTPPRRRRPSSPLRFPWPDPERLPSPGEL